MTTASTSEAFGVPALIEASVGTPEHAFRMTPMIVGDEGIEGSMRPGGLPHGADGRPAAGAVGVLVDDVLGFALIAAVRRPSWSVSVEISLDFLEPLTSTGALHVTGHGTDVDGLAGFASGDLRDDNGRVLVKARQHGRFLPRTHGAPSGQSTVVEPLASVLDLLGAVTSSDLQGATLTIADTRPWLNPLGGVHGGVAICAAEAVATCATMDSAQPLRTTSMSVSFGRPVKGEGPVIFKTRTIHNGRTLRLIDVTGSVDGRPCAFARVVRQASAAAQ